MIFNNIDIIPYNLNLKRALTNSKRTYLTTSGFIIKLSLDNYVGFGEASPLKSFSKENLKQIIWGFEEFKISLVENSNYDKDDFFDLIKIYTDKIPSLQFSLDMAFYDILSQKSSVSLAQYLNPSSLKIVKLGSFSLEDFQSNNPNVKIKLPCKGLKSDIKFLEKTFKNYSNNILFRVDFNRGHNINDVLNICDFLSNYKIEYIEEPLNNMTVDQLKVLKNKTNIKIAIDESIYNMNYKELIENDCIDYAILKPSIYGGVDKIIKLCKYLRLNAVDVVLSSSLENYIGTMGLINLAAALELSTAHGINNQIFYNYNEKLLFDEQTMKLNIENIKGLGVKWDD
jgi:o-succinylbenzoate synthase